MTSGSLTWGAEPYTNQQVETGVMTRSKPRQALAQSKNSPDRW
jgi:hypothetical protein